MLPSLGEGALFALLQSAWENSELPSLYAQLAHSYDRSRSDDSDVEDPKLQLKISKETCLAQKAIFNVANDWPEVLADRWHMVSRTIIKEIRLFACQLARCQDFLDHEDEMEHDLTVEQVLFCLKRIHITQNGFIDKKNTLLKILKDSQLKLHICPVLLIRNDINIDAIRFIYQKFQSSCAIKNLKYFEDCYSDSLELDWIMKCDDRCNRSDERFWNAEDLCYLLARRYFATAQALCNSKAEEKSGLYQDSLLKAALFVAEIRGHFDEETIMFLHSRMDSKTWLRLLKRESFKVFRCLISSWRYRHLCIESYKMMMELSMEVKFQEILFPYVMPVPGLPANCQFYNKYHRREILGVLVDMWKITPLKINQVKSVYRFFIPSLIAYHLDFDLMCDLIESYSEEVRKETVANVIIKLNSRGLFENIPACIKAAERFTIMKEDILHKDYIKSYIEEYFSQCCILSEKLVCESLFDDSETYANAETKINSLFKLVFISNDDIEQSKLEFLDDKKLTAKLIENFLIRDKKNCGHFLLWLHGFDKDKVLEFVNKAVHDETVLEAYLDLFMNENGSARGLYKIIEAGDWVGRMVLRHRSALNKWLAKLARDEDYNNSHELRGRFVQLFKSQKIPKRVISDFFKSPEGQECVLDLFCNIKSIEEDAHFHGKIDDFMERFFAFKSLFVVSKNIQKQITRWLTQFGGPNLDPKQKIRIRGQDYCFDEDELEKAHLIVGAYYRLFMVVLKNDLLCLPSHGAMTITEYSMRAMYRNPT